MNNWEARGKDRIPIELLRSAGDEVLDRFFNLVGNMHEYGELANDFKKSVHIIIAKKKGADKCDQYRMVSFKNSEVHCFQKTSEELEEDQLASERAKEQDMQF